MHTKTFGLTVLLSVFSISSVISQNEWPTKEWLTAAPGTVGLNSDSLLLLDKELASGKNGYIDGMLIIRHGKIAYEKSYQHDYSSIYKKEAKTKSSLNAKDVTGPYNYFNAWWHPFLHNTQLHTLQSVTKTITSVTIGVAISRSEFPDINTPVLRFFDTTSVKNIDSFKRKMTIRHLLTMTAGFKWDEFLPYTDTNNTGIMMETSCDWVEFVINQPMLNEPGTVFNYNSGATMLLAYIFNKATGKDIEEYAATYLFEPLGIKDYYWKRTPSGIADTEGGLYLDITDVAKFFYLYLKDGKWEDKQLVQPGWVQQSVTPYIAVSTVMSYGYKWWLYTYDKTNDKIARAGLGFGGQLPIILPEYDMVVVFTGWNVLPGRPSLNLGRAIDRVLACVKERQR